MRLWLPMSNAAFPFLLRPALRMPTGWPSVLFRSPLKRGLIRPESGKCTLREPFYPGETPLLRKQVKVIQELANPFDFSETADCSLYSGAEYPAYFGS